MHILTLSSLYPNARQPVHAVFVRTRMENFARSRGHELTVVAPVPYFPRLPFARDGYYGTLARVPAYEDDRGYPVHHPRALVTPKVGMRWYGRWMAAAVRRTVHEIHRRKRIDVIDGHYIYPDGTAAVAMGEELGVPVILSARGTDLNLYPGIPPIRPLLRRNLEKCRHLICVCTELKDEAVKLGMPAEKATVIGNGVDTGLFRRSDKAEARRALGLPADKRILLSVGHMTERKGFHILLEALSILERGDALLVIVGAGQQKPELDRLVREYRLEGKVLFPGAVRNHDLPPWYNAADLFLLASSREGWPNVLCEAQAVGLPVVATAIWGIPEIVTDESLGYLVKERTGEAMARAMARALETRWDPGRIEAVGQARTWENVSKAMVGVFEPRA